MPSSALRSASVKGQTVSPISWFCGLGGLILAFLPIQVQDLSPHDVDEPIKTSIRNPYAVGLVIGIADYQHPDVVDVRFAERDAEAIERLLKYTLGYREVLKRVDADTSLGRLKTVIRDVLRGKVRPNQSDVFVYYSGHGAPSAENNQAFLIPWDFEPNSNPSADNAYPLSDFYSDLAALKARSLTIVLDACFTGQSAGGPVLRGIRRLLGEVKGLTANLENGLIITAAGAKQIASWHKESRHGLLTYYFLRALRGEAADEQGQVIVAKLREYLSEGVTRDAFSQGRQQEPQVVGDPQQVLVKLPVSAVKTGEATVVPKYGTLEISINVGGDLWIDGIHQVTLDPGKAFWQKEIASGPHQVKIHKAGFKSVEEELIVPPDQTVVRTYGLRRDIEEPDMIRVQGDRFSMGSEIGYNHEGPVHEVTVNDFHLGKYEVTNAEFAVFVEETGYRTDAEKLESSLCLRGLKWQAVKGAYWKQPSGPGSDIEGKERYPVVHVTLNDARTYCEWLAKETGKPYRLPTEAEWDYACRAGTTTEYWWGNDFDRSKANTASYWAGARLDTLESWKSWREREKATYLLTEVGRFPENPWGFFDITGNAWEWCSSPYKPYPYRGDDAREDPSPTSEVVVRGASWAYGDGLPRSARRGSAKPTDSTDSLGFRIAY